MSCRLPSLGALLLVACGSSEEPGVFLGPIAASSFFAPAPSPPGSLSCVSPEEVVLDTIAPDPCPTPFAGNLPAGFAFTPQGVLLASSGEVRLLLEGGEGCPGGVSSPLAVPALSGPIAQAGRLWLAEAGGVQVWKEGALEATCALGGVRSLVASGEKAWAVTGGGVRPLVVVGGVCEVVGVWSLPGAPLAATASDGGGVWVALTQSGACGVAPVISRYTAEGALDEASPVFEAKRLGLCSVTGLGEVGGKLALLDGTCGRVVVVDGTSGKAEGIWEAPSGQTPVGAGTIAGGALLATAAGSEGGGAFRFFRVSF